jgi:type IX secretion system substrate protein
MNKLYKTKQMKKLLGLMLLFTGMVYAQVPAITNPLNQTLFDEANDSYEIFFVHTMAPAILGTLNANDYTVIFARDAVYQNPIPVGMYAYFTNNETVYVKVIENANQNNFATASFNVFLIPTPVIGQAQDLFKMDIPFDYFGTFDLTTQSTAVLNGLTGVNLAYYPSLDDARASTNQITNPAAYTNITNPQYVCAKVTNQATGSFSISQFRIVLSSVETITIPDNYFKIRILERYDYNNDDIIQMSEALSVTNLDLSNADIWHQPVYDLSGIENFSNVTQLFIGRNPLGAVDLTSLVNLKSVDMSSTNTTSLNVTGLTQLEFLNCDTGQLTTLDVSTCTSLKSLLCARNQLTTLNVNGLTAIEMLYCNNNQLTSLDVSNLQNLTNLCCSDNALTSLNLDGLTHITNLCYGNQLMGAVDTSHLNDLLYLGYGGGTPTALDFTNLTNLQSVWVWNSNLTTLDLSNLPDLIIARVIANNALTYVNMKNGGQFLFSSNPMSYNTEFFSNPNLLYVCTNETDLAAVNNQLSVVATTNGPAYASTYCTFTPGGDYNTITGVIRFDANNNGCDSNDAIHPNIKIGINDGTIQGETFSNEDGSYNFYTLTGSFIVTPDIENAAWFNFSPITATIPFADSNDNVTNQDFCITANGIHNDVEVVLSPLNAARPGFDAHYQLVYKNKGNQTLSGNVNLIFEDARLDLITAAPMADNQVVNGLTWNYTGLQPFETRVIDLVLNVNSPLETPSVNNGDILTFTAAVNPIANDEMPEDNLFDLNQVVINSMDPNDKTCLEGNSISPQQIGNYLHYTINFENLGTAEATNVVVKDVIDITKFDISSLQVIHASAAVTTTIKGNVVEFVFRNINLAPAAGDPPVGGHGTILFKIKTLSTLTVNDQVSNEASIFFDYNAPIMTNMARTNFGLLVTNGFETDSSIVLYPNPANDFIQIKCDSNIKLIELFDIQGRVLETRLENKDAVKLDVSNKAKGIYFLRITTDKGKSVEKIVKE